MSEISDYAFIKAINALPYVQHLYLYGSRARGDHQKFSDIDLAVDCPDANEYDWQHILKLIERADTLLKIDIVRLDALDKQSELFNNILKDAKPLSA